MVSGRLLFLLLAALYGAVLGAVLFGGGSFVLYLLGFLTHTGAMEKTYIAVICSALMGFGIGCQVIIRRK